LGFVRDLGWLWPREIFTKIKLGWILDFREYQLCQNTTSSNPKSYFASNAVTSMPNLQTGLQTAVNYH